MVDRFNRNIYTSGTVTYKDIDMSFKVNPVTGDLRKKTDLESIKQSLKNIFFTNRGERPFQPNFYGGISELLFEPLDDITISVLEDQVKTAIQNHEPRISVVELDIVPKEDQHSVDITLKFNMVNVLEPQTINILLKRIR